MRASHIKTFRGHGSFISSNLVGETHVPRNAPGTPQANARFRPARRTRGARMRARRAEETAHRGRARGRSRSEAGPGRSRAGSAREHLREREALEGEQRRARAKQGLGREPGRGSGGEQGGGLGENVKTRQAKRTVGPRTVRPPVRDSADSGGRTPAPRGTNDAIRPTPPPSQKCRGRSAGTPLLHGVRITRELQRARN